MSPNTILAKFLEMFFAYTETIDTYWPNGRNSIRVRMHDKQELIFTYNDPKDWSLMTVYANRTPKKARA